MKHIKKFIFESSTPMYWEMSREWFNERKPIHFNDSELNLIKKSVPSSDTSFRNVYSKDSVFLIYQDMKMIIRKYDDEWFSVMISDSKRKSLYNFDEDIESDYYKCDQMDGLLSLLRKEIIDKHQPLIMWQKLNTTNESYSMSSDEIQDYFLELTDKDDEHVVIEDRNQEELNFIWGSISHLKPDPIYLNSKEVDKYGVKKISDFDPSKDRVTYMMFKINHPKYRVKGNLDLRGYTLDTIKYYLKKFVRHSKVPVNVYVVTIGDNMYVDPLSKSIIKIEFIN